MIRVSWVIIMRVILRIALILHCQEYLITMKTSLTMRVVRSDHCSVNIGDGVVVTGNYPESNSVNM